MKLHSLKIKDELQGSSQYLACSVVNNSSFASHGTLAPRVVKAEDNDIFKDALPDFMSLPDSADTFLNENDMGKTKAFSGDVFYEAQGTDDSDFVSVTFLTRNPDSLDYDGIDTKMSIRMSKLEFFCNRPTLVALIAFGLDLSAASSKVSGTIVKTTLDDESSVSKDKTEQHEHALVKGLLGYGKGRVVFYLNMNVDSVSVFLNKEDSTPLAMFVQEKFVLDLKVHPSSISIEGTLGNFRLCDMSLGTEHCWGWLCDIRNQGAESLIQFRFNSYSSEDEDYEGYDYSLHGRLSAVRIVFLYRFVQEITTYFMELATPHTEEAVKYVDKVGGLEWLIQKYEIDGASAIKMDLLLDTPIIIVPRNSMSKDFMQLDLGHLRVRNEFSWHGSTESDPSAVHLDILDAEILGINMAVGIDGNIGQPMIRDGQDIHVYVRRSLRDIFRKVPTLSLEVKVGSLHAVMSDKEYNVILDCFYMNLNEQPKLPSSFRGGKSGSKDTIRVLADKVNTNSQALLSRTVTIMAVEVDYALLELCNGVHEELPLAHIALEGLWVSYRMTSFSEADLYITIPRFSILDIRPGTKPEMRLMLGSCTDVPKQASTGSLPGIKVGFEKEDSEAAPRMDLPNSTMFLMDYRWRLSSQSFVVRVQQPRVLVVPDFLLAVGEFFVPALGEITGREELMDPKNDPIRKSNSVLLSAPLYKQKEDIVHLSPNRQLVADHLGVDEYTYDGCGNTIILSEEKEVKELHSSGCQPVIIVGRGKRLRFVNVKFENGSLLQKYSYLGNDSSYSVSPEDGVQISYMDNLTTNSKKRNSDDVEELPHASDTSDSVQNGSSKVQSFSFEAQVVSPEFTFYDSSNSSLDDSSHGEKLLRAKTDFSFMFASKENDTWIRALLKDLTVEAGSGLIILDPVDISGGYTSVKDKTNISLISTDIYVHLPISVISLSLNLQSQVASALQFGNADLLSPCTNFDQVWVSPKENGHLNNLTFWRPRAPTNYVVLGDCVTSRQNPPSLAVMAVSSTYGRVRKPIGFKLIGSFSGIQAWEGVDGRCDNNGDCSLWVPIAPPGYLAVGCVAHVGSHPPPNYIVHCIRSDLVTSTTYSECIFSTSLNASFSSGFSIWRVDNVLGSFYAHPSASCPPKDSCLDLNHLVRWNSSRHHFSSKESVSTSTEHEYEHRQASSQTASSSGWDILRSISKTNCYMSTPNFERVWWDRGSDLRRPVSIWRPMPRPGYAILGDCITEGVEPPALGIIFKADNLEISAKPVQFTKVAHILRRGIDEAFFWYPIAPPGYASLGCVVSRTDEAPRLDSLCCPRMDLVSQANILETPISRFPSSKASQCWSIWKVENQACTFLARSDLKKPSARLAFTIGDSTKPKPRDNITAEMKLRCFSLTVLDSLGGMMTPRFDATITNMKLATHGQADAMNAVVICSIAASSFNTKLEAWEPLVEPFDGIFKFETYDTNVHPPSRLGRRARIAATSTMNINLSAANLEAFTETVISWRRQRELEQKAIKLNEGLPIVDDGNSHKFFCALRLVVDSQETSQQKLFPQSARTKCVKPLICKVNDLCEGIAKWNELFIFEIPRQGLARLEVEVTNLAAKAGKEPKLILHDHGIHCGTLPAVTGHLKAGSSALSIMMLPVGLTSKFFLENLGEVVGASSFSVGHGANTLKKVASARMLYQGSVVQNIKSYPLQRKSDSCGCFLHPQFDSDGMRSQGCLLASTSYFERKTVANFPDDVEDGKDVDRDVGFLLGLAPEGAWEYFRSFLPPSIITKALKGNFIAMEVVIKNGKKHAVVRGLATVANDSDAKLDISVCHVSMVDGHNFSLESGGNTVVEEIFENQRYNPISGWGNKWPGFRGNDPGRWSTRDFSYSSNDFFEPPLPSGWIWTSTWTVDKSQSVDTDGWAYGPEYRSLKWPPTSPRSCTKSALDSVRRRRWTRTRQRLIQSGPTNANNVVYALTPGSSAVLPWRSMSKDSDHCLQVRPCIDRPNIPYLWGYSVPLKDQPSFDQSPSSRQSSLKYGNKVLDSLFKLNQLEKKDVLLCCPSTSGKQFWLSASTDASVLQTELNAPVYDWKISINSPLKLENRLPCPVEFTIWEKLKDGKSIERHHDIISSRGTMHIYSADIRNPIYLTLFVQQGWVLEKDPVLLLDLSSGNHVSSFWMFHQQRKRRLRVSIERDMGGTAAAPKTIRFFVPYWLSNDSSLSLAYRVMEIEPLDVADVDSLMLSKAVKSAKSAMRGPATLVDGRPINLRRNIQVLEAIEDTSPTPSMLSPQDYVGRDGSYYSLSALLQMTSDRTKVVHFQPHTLFINRVGCSLCVQQCDTNVLDWIHPNDPPKHFRWQSSTKAELMKLRVDGYSWSAPFSVGTEGVMCISLINEITSDPMHLRVEVRSGTRTSRYEVLFRPNSLSSPYRFKLRMYGIQIDNQLPLTPMPVLFRPQRLGEETDYILKFSMTWQSNGSLDLCVYPYIGFQGPEDSAFLINIHEPIIWRLHGMIQQANLNRLYDTKTTAVSVDPIIQISVLNISEVRFKFSMAMSPTQRPVGVLGFWSSLMTALGNTENMPVRINPRFQEKVCMRQSVLVSNAISNIKKDLLSQPLQLLSGVDILGNASSAFGHMSKGVAALSMDKKFIQSRQKQENKGVEDFGDVIREGGGALAKGLFRGVTGILTKPLEGAKASGVEGFVQGVGKGIIGAAAQPVSGVLDLLSKTTEGANAMRMKLASALASEDQLLRRRLPRQTSNIIGQKKFNPARDPCSVLWDVLWGDLVTKEFTHGKKDLPKAPPSRLVLYLQSRSLDTKDQVRVIKCDSGSSQAVEVYSSIEQAISTYGPNHSKGTLKRKVTKPYSPIVDVPSADVIQKDGVSVWSPQQVPSSVPLNSTFGSSTN
ncbi:hypothetical protein RJ640_025804 [Escallonia rubra]|uniref:Vacuolar protein sorting-associated protein 13 VPS13 adaptor binding domain-containing protein n=1 Tax=Escallonia rubra TaxID=112253 RepID=A0AA88QXA1_9ASTE|nr:hypothetical protein RJ640_025804 [Escallonia rubra]